MKILLSLNSYSLFVRKVIHFQDFNTINIGTRIYKYFNEFNKYDFHLGKCWKIYYRRDNSSLKNYSHQI